MWPVQEELLSSISVIDDNREAARCGNDALLQIPMCVTAACLPGGYVVKVVDAPDREREMPAPFNEAKIAPMILDFWKLNKGNGRGSRYHSVFRDANDRIGF
ncbi:MAG TPA: hypothetical protein VIX19_12705 [Terriglobales bacterium]